MRRICMRGIKCDTRSPAYFCLLLGAGVLILSLEAKFTSFKIHNSKLTIIVRNTNYVFVSPFVAMF